MSAFAQRALIVTVPPIPRLRECVPLGVCMFPAGKIKICFPPTLGPLGPFSIKI